MGKSMDRAFEHALELAARETERTMLACWPNEWRAEFAEQNRLLAEIGEERLMPHEYLQCRAEDIEELQGQLDALRQVENG